MSNTINFSQNGYNGEVLSDLLTYTAQGNDSYREGLIHIKSGIQRKYTLPAMQLGDIIQDNMPTPTSSQGGANPDGANQYVLTERFLEPSDFMVYLEFNPRDYEQYWKFAQPDGNLVFRELDPKVQSTMLRLLLDKKNEYLGNAIWSSVKGGSAASGITAPQDSIVLGQGKERYFDGFMKRIVDNINATDEETIAGGQCVLSGTSLLGDGESIQKAMYDMWKKCPKQIRRKGLTFLMSWEMWDHYDQYMSSREVKYVDNTDLNQYRFKGMRVVPLVGLPEHTILLGQFTSDMDSNLWVGVDYTSDTEVVKIDRLQSNSELFFFQMRMKMDANIVRPAEIVVHTAYKAS